MADEPSDGHDHEWVSSRLIGRDDRYIVTHICCLHCEKERKIGGTG